MFLPTNKFPHQKISPKTNYNQKSFSQKKMFLKKCVFTKKSVHQKKVFTKKVFMPKYTLNKTYFHTQIPPETHYQNIKNHHKTFLTINQVFTKKHVFTKIVIAFKDFDRTFSGFSHNFHKTFRAWHRLPWPSFLNGHCSQSLLLNLSGYIQLNNETLTPKF